MIQSLLTKVAILSLLLLHLSHQACTPAQAFFPKIVGGGLADTTFSQIDYNQATDYLVAVGYSKDQGLRGDTLGITRTYPILVAYYQSSYIWGKSFSTATVFAFNGVKINRLGTKLVVTNDNSPRTFYVMDIANGDILAAIAYTGSNTYDTYRRNLLLLDDGTILFGDSSAFIKILLPSTSAMKYSGSYATVGIQINAAQSYLHVLSWLTGGCQITVLNVATFTRVYQYQVQCTSISVFLAAQTYQSCIYDTSPTVDTIVFQETTKFFRINNQYSSTTYTTSTLHDPGAPALMGRGLWCMSPDLVYSLMYGAQGADSSRFIVAEVNFISTQITYRRYLQQVSTFVYSGYIYEGNKFFIVQSMSSTVRKSFTPSVSIGTTASKKHGIIYSTTLTCQAIDLFTYPVVTGTANSFSFTPTTNNYSPSPLVVVDQSSSLPTTTLIASTEFEGKYISNCGTQVPQAPLDYTSLSSTQATNSITFAIEDASPKTIPITAFTAAVTSPPIAAPSYSYTLKSFNGPVTGVSVTQATGNVVILDISALGLTTYSIIIEGKLQDCQTIKSSFTIKGQPNTAPLFQGIAAIALPSVSVEQAQITNYPLPTKVDPDAAQTITVSLIDGGSSAYPTFVDFTDTTNIAITIQPTLSTTVGTYPILIKLSDGVATTTYTLDIQVTAPNTAPVFQGILANSLPFVSVEQALTANYHLPTIVDPDTTQVITITLIDGGSNAYPTFADFSDLTHTSITIQPTFATTVTSYPVFIQISDGITSTTYTLNIQVTAPNTAPLFQGILANAVPGVSVEQAQTTNYPLPTIVDPDTAQIILVTLIDGGSGAYPAFVDFSDPTNTAIQIEPTLSTMVGTYLVSIQLNDGVATTTYTLDIEVTAPNTAPVFSGITVLALPGVSVEQAQTANYNLPAIFDPDTTQTLLVTLIDGGSGAYPTFADFTDSTHSAITIQPTMSTLVGAFQVSIQLNDGVATTTYTLDIQVTAPPPPPTPPVIPPPASPLVPAPMYYSLTNKGPPLFNSTIESISIKVGDVLTYSLPQQIDPDQGDKIAVSVQLKDAAIFVKYESEEQKFTVQPVNGSVYKEQYEIIITLTDDNLNPKKSIYKLGVKVEMPEVEQIQDDIVVVPKKWNKTYKCGIRIIQVSRKGRLQLKITSSQHSAAAALANLLNDTDIQVFVPEISGITTKIESILEENIISINMEFKNRQEISNGVELDYLHVKIVREIVSDFGVIYAYLPNGTSDFASIPIQYSTSKKRSRLIIFQSSNASWHCQKNQNKTPQLYS